METVIPARSAAAAPAPEAAELVPFVLPFAEIGREGVSVVGGKGANLGEMIRAGLPVPDGFVVTLAAYRRFLEAAGLEKRIEARLREADVDAPEKLRMAAEEIGSLIRDVPLPVPVRRAIVGAYEGLAGENGWPLVAVRSSATAEDAATSSFAGMFQSFLNVRGEEDVLHRIRDCWASAFGARVLFYRRQQQLEGEALVAVVVQRMVQSEKSGVLFTVNPATGDRDTMVVEAAFGLGEVVVGGQITPDRYEVEKGTHRMSRSAGHKRFMLALDPATGDNLRVELGERADEPVLTDDEAVALARLGDRLEEHYGVPQDAEWAIENGKIFLVQTRPITTLVSKKGRPESAPGGPTEEGRVLVRGLAASPGLGSGRARVLMTAGEADVLEKGEVLVAPTTTPDWVPVMRRAVAIVTDAGGMTSHAAIVSRELGIPCVVGTRDGTTRVATGTAVSVDGITGEVREDGFVGKGRPPAIPAALGAPATSALPTATRLYVNLAEPERAEEVAALAVDGVGLLRAEFMMLEVLGGRHPRLLIEEGRADDLVAGLAGGLRTFARAFHPRPVVYRTMDFRSNEFRGLEGGERFEPGEANPMIGYRGCFRYTREPDLFRLELSALAEVRRQFAHLHLMLPFVRTARELSECLGLVRESELGGQPDLEIWVMAEVPSIFFRLEDYVELGITGVSIGSNDLTQLVLGVDRDSEVLAGLFDERDPAVTGAIEFLVRECRRLGVTSSICGQAPSVHPGYVDQLVEWGIDSVSVSPDVVDRTRAALAAAEHRILVRAARERLEVARPVTGTLPRPARAPAPGAE